MAYETNPKHKYKKSTIIAIGQDKPLAEKARHYVNKEEFYQELVIRREQMDKYRTELLTNPNAKPPKISNAIGENLLKIANNLAKKYTFAKLEFKDEMILSAMEQCISYIDSFDIHKTKNPFSYFTQTIYYAFLDTIKKETKQKYIKYKSTLESMALQEFLEQDSSENTEHTHDNFELPDVGYMHDFCEVFESNESKRKESEKTKALAKSKSGIEDLFI